MLTSKPLAGSVKQQAIPYGTSPDVNKQALGKLILTEQVQMLTSKPLAGSVKKQAIVGADLMAMCPKVARQSTPISNRHVRSDFDGPKSVSHLMAMLCFS